MDRPDHNTIPDNSAGTSRAEPVLAQVLLKAPVEWFENLDRFRLEQPGKMKPSRPATIRWIVHQFLLREAEKAARRKKRAPTRQTRPKKKPQR